MEELVYQKTVGLAVPLNGDYSNTLTFTGSQWSGKVEVHSQGDPNPVLTIKDGNLVVEVISITFGVKNDSYMSEGGSRTMTFSYRGYSDPSSFRMTDYMPNYECLVFRKKYRELCIKEIRLTLGQNWRLPEGETPLRYFLLGNNLTSAPPSVMQLMKQKLPNSISDFMQRFEAEPFADHVDGTDAIIRAEDKDFHVHEDVLSQSDALVAMLHSPMVEGDTRAISIEEFSADDVEAFLRVLYNRRLILHYSRNTSALLSIYRLADKYVLPDIQDLVKAGLPQIEISEKCICDVLAFAIIYEIPDFVDRCVKVSKAIPASFWNRDDFKQLKRDNPAFALEFMSKVLSRVSDA